MTDDEIIAAVRRGTHVLVPAHGDWTITKIEQPRSDAVATLEIEIATVDDVRALSDALWAASDAHEE